MTEQKSSVELIGEIPSPRAKMNKAKRKRNQKLKSYKEADDEFKIARLEKNIYQLDMMLKAVKEEKENREYEWRKQDLESCESIQMLTEMKLKYKKRKNKLKKRH